MIRMLKFDPSEPASVRRFEVIQYVVHTGSVLQIEDEKRTEAIVIQEGRILDKLDAISAEDPTQPIRRWADDARQRVLLEEVPNGGNVPLDDHDVRFICRRITKQPNILNAKYGRAALECRGWLEGLPPYTPEPAQ